MVNIEIINEKPVTMAELKEKLNVVKKENKELNETAEKTLDYLNKFVSLKAKDAEKIKENINKLNIPRLKERHITKIIDVMPEDMESLKLVFASENITIKQEDLSKILDVLK